MSVRVATVLRERELRRVLCAWLAAFRKTPIEHHQSEAIRQEGRGEERKHQRPRRAKARGRDQITECAEDQPARSKPLGEEATGDEEQDTTQDPGDRSGENHVERPAQGEGGGARGEQREDPHGESPARSETQRSGGGAEEQRARRSEGGHDGGHRIRTCTGLPPAVFKTAALPVRSSPPGRG